MQEALPEFYQEFEVVKPHETKKGVDHESETDLILANRPHALGNGRVLRPAAGAAARAPLRGSLFARLSFEPGLRIWRGGIPGRCSQNNLQYDRVHVDFHARG